MVIVGPFNTKNIASVQTNFTLLFRDRSSFIAVGWSGGEDFFLGGLLDFYDDRRGDQS